MKITEEKNHLAYVGDLWVEGCWTFSNTVTFKKSREDATTLDEVQVNWLKENVGGIKIIKIKVIEEEV